MTYAQLKRDAATGKMSLELVEWYGEKEFPERLRGIRRVAKAKSFGLVLINADGQESELRINKAKLMEYDGNTLTVYDHLIRDMNDEEKAIMDKFEEMRKNHQYNYYSEMVDFLKKSSCPYLAGDTNVGGKILAGDKIHDYNEKGEVALKYIVHMAE